MRQKLLSLIALSKKYCTVIFSCILFGLVFLGIKFISHNTTKIESIPLVWPTHTETKPTVEVVQHTVKPSTTKAPKPIPQPTPVWRYPVIPTTDVTKEPTVAPTATPLTMYYTENDVIALAKTLYNECRGVVSDMEKACVAWVVCNRVDAGKYGRTVYDVVAAPHQFAYRSNTPVTDQMYDLAIDVLTRWNKEKNGHVDVGRVLPSDYLFFHGDGKHNYFRKNYSDRSKFWNYSLENPYKS